LRTFRDVYALLMLLYIRMNVITHGDDYKALIYKHECDCVWANFRALIYERTNVILQGVEIGIGG